jgi:ribosomal protein S27E
VADRFIPLNCQSCGAKLEVYDDMTRFACGYCGVELLVERRGGTVVLKAVTEAIQKVQIGTDKTAAELALPRLERELLELQASRSKYVDSTKGCVMGCGGLLAFAALLAIVEGIIDISSPVTSFRKDASNAIFWGVCLVIAASAVIKSGYGHTPDPEKASQLREIEAEIERVERQIAENKGILRGT